jgi:hypothetical protein
MKHLLRFISWKKCFALTLSIMPFLALSSFYGIYTHKFYFTKIDNYILPLLLLVHLLYLKALRQADQQEISDLSNARNLEYGMYVIYFVYLYKFAETSYKLSSYFDFSEEILPTMFLPVGLVILFLQIIFLIITLVIFRHRKERFGPYRLDRINQL